MSETRERAESSPSDAFQGPRPTHPTYYLVFFFMQAALAVLTWYCHSRPLILPWSNMDDDHATIMSGFSAIFSLWQSAAAWVAKQICSAEFEWEKKKKKEEKTTVRNDPETVKCVNSKPVSDFIRSGKMFQVAVLAYPALSILSTVGHSAITVAGGVSYKRPLPIGFISTSSLTTDTTDTRSKVFFERRLESDMVVRLEQLYKTPLGYVASPNYFIPLPIEELNSTSEVEYESDVLFFRHKCRWQAPDEYSGDIVTIGNKTWSARISSNVSSISDSGNVGHGSSIIFLLPEDDNLTSDSVYLFLGANATISPAFNSTSNNTWIDLSNLPKIFNRNGFTSRFTNLRSLRAPLATLLVCHPDLELLSRRVRLRRNTDRTEPDVTMIQSDAYVTSPGNIELQAARTLFTIILNTTTSSEDSDDFIRGTMNANLISANMLLDGFEDATKVSFSPLNLSTIDNNVDKYTLSALKPFNGYQGTLRGERGAYAQNVTGNFTGRRLALQTSLQFAIFNTVLFGVLGIVLAVLAYPN